MADLDIGALITGLGADVKALKKDLNDAKKELGDYTKDSEKIADESGTKFVANLKSHWVSSVAVMAGFAGAFIFARKALSEFGDAIERQEKRLAFENLANSTHKNAQKIIADLKDAAGQMITTQEAVATGGRAMILGLDSDVMTKLMKIARASARVTGQSITQAFGDITLGVARQSKMILDNLGLLLDYDSHLNKVAKTYGKTTEQLSDTQRRQAFLNATMEAGEVIITRVGDGAATLNERLAAVKTTIAETITGMKDYVTGLKHLDKGIAASRFGLLSEQYKKQKEELDKLVPKFLELREQVKAMQQGKTDPSKYIIENFEKAESKVLALQKSLNEISRLLDIGDTVKQYKSLYIEMEEIAALNSGMTKEQAIKWEKEYAALVDKTADNILRTMEAEDKKREEIKEKSIAESNAIRETYRDMYSALRDDTEKYYDFQVGLLEEQMAKEIEVTKNLTLAHEVYYARLRELDEKRLLRSNSMLAGIQVFTAEQEREGATWAGETKEAMESLQSGFSSNMSTFTSTTLKNWNDLDEAWKSLMQSMLDSFINTLSQMANEMLASMVFKWLGSFAGSYAGAPPETMGSPGAGAMSDSSMAGAPYVGQMGMKSMGSGQTTPSPPINLNIQAWDGQDVMRTFDRYGNDLANVILKKIDTNRTFKKKVRGGRTN